MLHPTDRVLCICRGGQVRSIAARNLLADRHGFRRVLTCGWEKNDADTVDMLCRWANAIIVVGSVRNWHDVPGESYAQKTYRLDIGRDVWGRYDHPELIARLTPLVEKLLP